MKLFPRLFSCKPQTVALEKVDVGHITVKLIVSKRIFYVKRFKGRRQLLDIRDSWTYTQSADEVLKQYIKDSKKLGMFCIDRDLYLSFDKIKEIKVIERLTYFV